MHLQLAALLRSPELELDPLEAKRLADAANEVARHYPLTATEKARAWVQMTIVASNIYAPRAVAIWHRKNGLQPEAAVPPSAPTQANGASSGAAPATPGQLDPLAMLQGATPPGAA